MKRGWRRIRAMHARSEGWVLALSLIVLLVVAGGGLVSRSRAQTPSGGSTRTAGRSGESTATGEADPALLEALASPPGLAAEAREPSSSGQGTEAEVSESRVLFRSLDASEAGEAVAEAFPSLLEEPVYTPPSPEKGEQVTGYTAPNVATLALPDGGRGVIESVVPLVAKTDSGKQAPVDLTLEREEGALQPVNPITPLELPLRLDEGVTLPRSGLTVTPVDASGASLGGAEAANEGGAAFYANADTDTDLVAKPVPNGFETQTILRSPASEAKLFFRFSGEGSIHLAEVSDEAFAVEEDGKILATIPPASATDAAGASVPVSLEAVGDQLVLAVDDHSAEYQYPIAVDPTISEKNWGYFEQGPWRFTTNSPSNFNAPFTAGQPSFPEIYTPVSYGYGVYGAWNYTTQGVSRIYSFEPSVWSGYSEDQMTNVIGLIGAGGWEPEPHYLGTYIYPQQTFVQCPVAGCPTTGGTAGNTAVYEKIAINNGSFADSVFQNYAVRIAQDTGPSVAFDTTDKEIEGHPNPLYGSGVWLTSAQAGRLKVLATDPGIGIYKRSISASTSWSGALSLSAAAGCVGIQCQESYQYVANVGNLPEGVDTVQANVQNATAATGTGTAQVKIDNTAPYASVVGGLPKNGTITRGSNHKLEISLGDGKTGLTSSGVAGGRNEVSIDHLTVLGEGGSPGCTPGPCQVTRSYELHSQNESPGVHTIEIYVEDKAGNNSFVEVPYVVKAGPSEEVGPGKLELAGGGYSLASTDVSPDAAGLGLSVTRSYASLDTTTENSPFGSPWQISVGGWQGVKRLTNGAAVFTDARGRSTLFEPNKEGGFTNPPGYQGWSLRYGEGPSYESTFGTSGSGNGQFNQPTGLAIDSNGTIWVVDHTNSRIQAFNSAGEYLRRAGSYGSGNAQLKEPAGIAVDPKNNVWVADAGNNRVEEFSEKGTYLGQFGTKGAGNGQFEHADGIAVDSKGNIWVSDAHQGRVQEFNEKGEYLRSAGTKGGEKGQLGEPRGIAIGPGGNLWVADLLNSRIVEFNEKGEFVRQFGSYGSEKGQFEQPGGVTVDSKGVVWVVDRLNSRVEAFTEKGEFVSTFGSAGTGTAQFHFGAPNGIAATPSGNLYVADQWNNRVQEWSSNSEGSFILVNPEGHWTTFKRPGGTGELFLPRQSGGPGTSAATTYQFETFEGQPRLHQALAPVPVGVSCTTLVRGCRALTFSYDVGTTATSDEPSGWGAYAGRLGSVELHAWDPQAGAMTSIPVADYVYDVHGRLRAVWDPRTSPALKTLYGYDSAGRVTALTPPGQETWSFKYGSVAGESGANWLLSVSRNNGTAPIGSGLAPQNTAAPTLSSPYLKVGVTYKVLNGTWANSPTDYNYQWVRCTQTMSSCTRIAGATDQSYTTVSADNGYTLIAEVTATNSGGSGTAKTAQSGVVGALAPLEFSSQFGKTGTTLGQLTNPRGVGVDSSGAVWVVDSGNNRLEKFSSTNVPMATYGSAGAGTGQFSGPTGLAINPSSGNIYVADTGNNRIEEFSSTGTFIRTFGTAGPGLGQLQGPTNLTIDSSGNVWVVDTGNHRIEEFSSTGTAITTSTGSGVLVSPKGIGISGGYIFVSDTYYDVVWKLSMTGGFVGCICESMKAGTGNGEFNEPGSIVTDSATGTIYVVDSGNNRVQLFKSTGAFAMSFGTTGSGVGQFTTPAGIALTSSGNVYVPDSLNRVQKWIPYSKQATVPPPDPNRATTTIVYHVPLSGAAAPYDLSATAAAKWGQTDLPKEATAIFPPDQVPAAQPANYKRAAIFYMDDAGDTVNSVAPGGRISTMEYDEHEKIVRSLTAANRALALEAGAESAVKAQKLDTDFTYSSDGTDLLSVLGPLHKIKLTSGKEVEARLHTRYLYDQSSPEGARYHLVTTETEGAQVVGEVEGDIRTKTFSYSGQGNLGWKIRQPTSTTVDPGGLNLVSTTVFDPATGAVTEVRKPAAPEGGDPRATRTIYYSAKAAEPKACGEHPEWANLPCETLPASQPVTIGLPELPVATSVYNVWDEPTATTETSGSASRSSKVTYDSAGRPTVSEVTSSTGVALSAVTTAYSPTTGVPISRSRTGPRGAESISSEYNSAGQLTKYTDADGNVSTYTYDIDGRPVEVGDGKGTQIFGYDTTTGDVTSLKDSGVGTFTATYDSEGHLASASYPNGMTTSYTYDATGTRTKMNVVKTTECTESCTWYTDEITPSIHGQWMKQVSTRGTEAYAYDASGRLTWVQENPGGAGCTTTEFGYDADTNRTSLTTRPPGEGGACSETGGTTTTNSFDSADRLNDPGVVYDPFGDITELPAADAGGHSLSSTFYADGSLASQAQNGQTIAYAQDPAGRNRETVGSGTSSLHTISHFSGGSDSPSWTVDEAGNWTRFVTGITGTLSAIQKNGGEVRLQVADLHGDIVGTAPLGEAATGLTWSTETTVTGVPLGGKPPKYGWLGFAQRPTELESGVVSMGASSYVPQLDRYLQPTVVNHDSSAYTYAGGDPVNESELNGQYSPSIPVWLEQFEAHPPNLPPPPPPPAEEEQFEAYEIDPTAEGKYGRLHISVDVENCNEFGCQATFHFRGDIVGAEGRSSALHMYVLQANPEWGEREYIDYGAINGTRTPSYTLPLFIDNTTIYAFRLFVRVGTHKGTLGFEFFILHGEIAW